MSGTHGEHNKPPKRLSTRAMELDKNSLMCSSRDSHPDYNNSSDWISTETVTNSTRSQQGPLNQFRATTFAQPAVSATFTHNQLTQGSIQIPLRYHVVITFQKNQSGSNSVSISNVCFDNSPGTHNSTCSPQCVQPRHWQHFRSQVSLVSLRSNRLDLLPSLANNVLQP